MVQYEWNPSSEPSSSFKKWEEDRHRIDGDIMITLFFGVLLNQMLKTVYYLTVLLGFYCVSVSGICTQKLFPNYELQKLPQVRKWIQAEKLIEMCPHNAIVTTINTINL